jgi:predicted permease
MNTLSSPLMLFAVLATGLPGTGHSAGAVVRAQPRAVCPPVAAAAVPADYWLYHALVAPTPTLTPPVSAAPHVRTACAAGKVIRT